LCISDDDPLGFSTSSHSPSTRHKQTGLLLRDQLLVNENDEFIINEFCMWRGPQSNQGNTPSNETTNNEIICLRSAYEENLKLRLMYTFVNEQTKAINRRCAYTVTKYLF